MHYDKYNNLVFDVELLPRTCQVQKCTFTLRRRRCNCKAKQFFAKNLLKVTWLPERDSNLRPSGRKAPNPTTKPSTPHVSHHAAHNHYPVMFIRVYNGAATLSH